MTRVILAYKNFAAFKGISHIGLGVSALNTAKVLNSEGIPAQVLPIAKEEDLGKFLVDSDATHVVVSAPWIRTETLSTLCATYPDRVFAINCHSNVGFLQADARGIELVREGLGLEAGAHNFHVCGNSTKFCLFIRNAYASPCTYLPNLYYLDGTGDPGRPGWPQSRGTLRIGVFGATRPQKNFLSAVGAGIEISHDLKTPTDIWVNVGREDSPEAKRILWAAKKLTEGLPLVTLREAPWASWPRFRELVASMHLLLQPSYTESFNMVTADGASRGVPSVVSDAINWAPGRWMARADDVFDIARVGVNLIFDPRTGRDGLTALQRHNEEGLAAWRQYVRV